MFAEALMGSIKSMIKIMSMIPVHPGAYGKQTPNAERRTSNAELAASEFDVQRSTFGVGRLQPQ